MSESFQVRDVRGRLKRREDFFPDVLVDAWSNYPAVSDVQMAGNNLINISDVTVTDAITIGSASIGSGMLINPDLITSVDGNNYLDFVSSTLRNGEPAGVGADLHLVSQNGVVRMNGIYGDVYTEVDGSSFGVQSLVFESSNISAIAVVSPFANNSQIYLEHFDVALANNGIQLFRPGGTHDLGFAVCGVGQVWNMAAVTGIMSFTSPQHYFGNNTDDGTDARVQIRSNAGLGIPALSIDGVLGITDTIPNTFNNITVTGGIITGWI